MTWEGLVRALQPLGGWPAPTSDLRGYRARSGPLSIIDAWLALMRKIPDGGPRQIFDQLLVDSPVTVEPTARRELVGG